MRSLRFFVAPTVKVMRRNGYALKLLRPCPRKRDWLFRASDEPAMPTCDEVVIAWRPFWWFGLGHDERGHAAWDAATRTLYMDVPPNVPEWRLIDVAIALERELTTAGATVEVEEG